MRFAFILLFPALLFGQEFQNFIPGQFRELGPERGGRSTTVEGVQNEENVFYAGYTGSGVWKTEDYGETWKNISDGFFETPSIGSIEVYQKNPSIIFVGTGTDGMRSNLIEGRGIYKSIDAGATWTHMGLKETGQIGSVETHPDDPDVVFVAAIGNAFRSNEERGVYRSKDGGKSWSKVLYVSDQTGFSDLEFHPSNPNIIYAAAWKAERKPWTIISGGEENGIYKSTDGGDTWKKMDNGLPQLKGKIDLAVSPADPERLYALVEAEGKKSGLYRTDNGGENFTQISDKEGLLNRPFYYCNLYADPTNASHLYSLATRGFESHDGGKTWERFDARHGDHHDIWINANNPKLIIESNDGGANISLNGGKTWSTQFNQPTSEIYQIEVDNNHPYWVYGGQQDNYSTVAVPVLPPYGMQAGHTAYITNTGGCETGPAVPHPNNPDIVYSNCKGRFSRFNKSTGIEQSYNVGAYFMYGHDPKDLPFRFQRVSPIHISPHNPEVIYHCSQFVHKTEDEGKTWQTISPDLTAFTPETQGVSGEPFTRDITGEEFYSTIYAIQESKLEKGVIWTGANDGPIHVTQNDGKTWEEVTPSDLPPGGRVDAVEPSQHVKGRAYVAVLRYQLGDPMPYIYMTDDYGATWKLINNGIPEDYPVRVVREDPINEQILYAGTEYGLFVSVDGGNQWEAFQKNLPIVPITDLKLHRNDLVMSTMGRGFWIFDDLGALRKADSSLSTSKEIGLYPPSPTYMYRYSSGRGADQISTHIDYPSPGVEIGYYLNDSIEDILFMEITNERGDVIRRYKSESESKDTSGTEEDMNLSIIEYVENKSLKTSKGAHQLRWNLRHDNRALVSPGIYQVKLFNDNFNLKGSFELMADPRLKKDGFTLKDYREQEAFAMKVGALVDEVNDFVKKTEKKVKALKDNKDRTKKEDAQLRILESKLERLKNEDEIAYPEQRYVSQLRYLYGMTSGTYQHINQDMKVRFEQLQKEWAEIEGLE
ncbi:VPS10 domain-containing protein [Portibacter marinus]|uniref:VPS10 domain-containing protein n=1 Tax=Portibacter marinus TaxID=2898660 RepID=UPI001F3B2E7F|nr:hypothetical protein [Portibacter marinus]